MANFKDAIARMLGMTQNQDIKSSYLDVSPKDLASYDDALKLSDAYTTRGQDLYTDALAMSEAYNPTPKKKLTDILPKTEKKTGKGLTTEKLGNIYKYIMLPAMGIAETISSRGKSPGTNAMAAMEAFEAGYEGRKAKELGDLKIAEAKKELARKEALRKQLKDLEGYKVGDISTIADKDVLTDTEKTAMEQGFVDSTKNIPLSTLFTPQFKSYKEPTPFGLSDVIETEPSITVPVSTVVTPSPMVPLSSKVISDRKRASMAKMLGITEDKLVGDESVIDAKAQDAIEGYVRETDPLKYYELISKKQTLPKGASMKDKLLSEYDRATPERKTEIVSLLKLANNPFKESEVPGELPSDYDTYSEEDKLNYISNRLARSGNLSASANVITKGLGVKTDKRDFESKLSKNFEKISNDYRDVKTNYGIMQNAYNSYKATPNDKQIAGIVDQTLITVFNKILDPRSVVRESEYDRTPQGQALLAMAEGWISRIKEGGPGIIDKYRDEMVKQAGLALQAYQKAVKLMANKYKSDAHAYGLDIERIIPSDVLSDIGYVNNKTPTDKNTSTTIPVIKTQDEFNALPSGAEFYDINGVLKEKE